MMIEGIKLEIIGKTARQPGVDSGPYPIIVLDDRLIKGVGRIVMIKQPGHKYWSSLHNPWAYTPTRIITVLLDKKNNVAKILAEYEPRKSGRQ